MIPLGVLAGSQVVAGGWTPADLVGLTVWWDASDSSTISHTSGSVTEWRDKSGSGIDLSPNDGGGGSTGSQTQNSRNVIGFNGSQSLKRASTYATEWKFLHDGTKTLVAVVANKATTGGHGLFSSRLDGGGRTGHWLYMSETTMWPLSANGGSAAASIMAANYVTVGTPFLTTYIMDPNGATDITLWKNDGTGASNNSGGSPSTAPTTDDLIVGSLYPSGYRLNGWIAEVVMVTGTDATESNRLALLDYLNTKWGIY